MLLFGGNAFASEVVDAPPPQGVLDELRQLPQTDLDVRTVFLVWRKNSPGEVDESVLDASDMTLKLERIAQAAAFLSPQGTACVGEDHRESPSVRRPLSGGLVVRIGSQCQRAREYPSMTPALTPRDLLRGSTTTWSQTQHPVQSVRPHGRRKAIPFLNRFRRVTTGRSPTIPAPKLTGNSLSTPGLNTGKCEAIGWKPLNIPSEKGVGQQF
jgi:hypothetical protein